MRLPTKVRPQGGNSFDTVSKTSWLKHLEGMLDPGGEGEDKEGPLQAEDPSLSVFILSTNETTDRFPD